MTRLTGAFFQLDGRPVEAMLPRFAAAGLDTAIVQAFAPGADALIAAAEGLGIAVWLGLPFREVGWYAHAWWPPFLERLGGLAAADAAELAARYPKCAGLYIPYETNGLASPWAMGRFYGRISGAAGLPTMISPFTKLMPRRPHALPALARWWEIVLARAGVQVLAWQDGVGSCPGQLRRVPREAALLRRVCGAHGVRFWGNLEAFERVQGAPGFVAVSADPARFARQLAACAPFAEKLVAFDFNHYLDPAAGDRQAELYASLLGR